MDLFFALFIFVLTWSVDSSDRDARQMILYVFIAVHVAMFGTLAVIFYRIWTRGDATVIMVKDGYTGMTEPQKHWEYDMARWRDMFFTRFAVGTVVASVTALWYHLPFPMLLQCINNPLMLLSSELFKVYILGQEETGELQRPWKDNGFVPEWLKTVWAESEKESANFLQDNPVTGASKNGSPSNSNNAARRARRG